MCRIDEQGHVVMTIVGDLDLHGAPVVLDEFGRWAERAGSHVPIGRIDAMGVDFISAAGITAMLRICRHQPTSIDASTAVASLITLCDLGDILLLANRHMS